MRGNSYKEVVKIGIKDVRMCKWNTWKRKCLTGYYIEDSTQGVDMNFIF